MRLRPEAQIASTCRAAYTRSEAQTEASVDGVLEHGCVRERSGIADVPRGLEPEVGLIRARFGVTARRRHVADMDSQREAIGG